MLRTLRTPLLPASLLVGLLGGCSNGSNPADGVLQADIGNVVLEKIFGEEEEPYSRYLGRVVVLNIWAPWCPPCLEEMPSLQRLSGRLDPDRFAVIGLTGDERFLAQEFLLRHEITFANYFDTDDRLKTEILGEWAYPETLLVGVDGRVMRRIVGSRDWADEEMVDLIIGAYIEETGKGLGR